MAKAKVYSIQPRFKKGDLVGGWSLIDGVMKIGAKSNIPVYGSDLRDSYLSMLWADEPMLSGAMSTWIEKVQSVDWKVTGGKVNAKHYAQVLADSEGGRGWSEHAGLLALDFLTCDKGSMEELGRSSPRSRVGRVMGINHIDAARMIRTGRPKQTWRYYPVNAKVTDLWNDNIIQIKPMPVGRDRFRGYGYSAMSRLLDAKMLMLGYLTYFRQEIGDLPPELIMIINGLPQSKVKEAIANYQVGREQQGLDIYSKLMWLGSNNPARDVSVEIKSLTTPNKSFNYQTMVEWWAKTIALSLGIDVGEIWLLQTGESKTVQTVQAMKSRGKGVARYLQEIERRYNLDVMPFGVKFVFDNMDQDDQDKARAEIIAASVESLAKMTDMGVTRQELVFELDEIRQLAADWDVIPPEMVEEDLPTTYTTVLKGMASEVGNVAQGYWTYGSDLIETYHPPLLKGREANTAMQVYHWFESAYKEMGPVEPSGNGAYLPPGVEYAIPYEVQEDAGL